MALIAIGVLFATSEYRRGMIRTTFAATPRRGRVLAAKAIVLGTTSFAVGLVGASGRSRSPSRSCASRASHRRPSRHRPLSDGPVLRALLLTAAFMTGVAVVAPRRRHAGAAQRGRDHRHDRAGPLPLIVGMILPGTLAEWLMYTTLAGGMATQRAKPPTITLAEPWAMIGPWAGHRCGRGVGRGALGLAWWRLRTRDA